MGKDHPYSRKTWNDKILDYEIERPAEIKEVYDTFPVLETIRFSITRLKVQRFSLSSEYPSHPWNDKILDYEIESKMVSFHGGPRVQALKR